MMPPHRHPATDLHNWGENFQMPDCSSGVSCLAVVAILLTSGAAAGNSAFLEVADMSAIEGRPGCIAVYDGADARAGAA